MEKQEKLEKGEKIVLSLLGVLILLGGASMYFCLNPKILSRPDRFFLIDWLAITAVFGAFSFTLMRVKIKWAIYFALFTLAGTVMILAIKFGILCAFIGFILFSVSGWITEKV